MLSAIDLSSSPSVNFTCFSSKTQDLGGSLQLAPLPSIPGELRRQKSPPGSLCRFTARRGHCMCAAVLFSLVNGRVACRHLSPPLGGVKASNQRRRWEPPRVFSGLHSSSSSAPVNSRRRGPLRATTATSGSRRCRHLCPLIYLGSRMASPRQRLSHRPTLPGESRGSGPLLRQPTLGSPLWFSGSRTTVVAPTPSSGSRVLRLDSGSLSNSLST